MYEHYVGKIPDNLELDHWWKNPLCCRPGHLEPVTHKENVLRGTGLAAINAVKTHCPYGHEYTEENTFFILKNKRGCKICLKDRNKEKNSKRSTERAIKRKQKYAL